ncbi:Holliday junction resolvase MOC1, chloroplastic [Linum grandiflorum]
MEVLQPKLQNLTSSNPQIPLMRFPGGRSFFFNAFSSAIPTSNSGCPSRVTAHLKTTTVAAAEVARLKENWLDSLTCPLPSLLEQEDGLSTAGDDSAGSGSSWVIGIDPDLSGAIALLKTQESVCSAQVFDAPSLKVMVGKRIRKRLDAKSIVQLLRSFDSPELLHI